MKADRQSRSENVCLTQEANIHTLYNKVLDTANITVIQCISSAAVRPMVDTDSVIESISRLCVWRTRMLTAMKEIDRILRGEATRLSALRLGKIEYKLGEV